MRGSARCILTTIATAAGLSLAHTADAKTFHCNAGDVECLIFAINDANNNGPGKHSIWLEAGTYTLTEVNNLTDGANGLPSITGRITIDVVGSGTVTLARSAEPGTPPFRIFHVSGIGHLTIRGVVVTNGAIQGAPSGGGGLFNAAGRVRIERSTFTLNYAGSGAGLQTAGGAVTIEASTFAYNYAGGTGGGVVNRDGEVRIRNSTFDGNDGIGAGAIANRGTLRIVGSRFSNHVAALDVGGLDLESGSVWIRHSTFDGNGADGAGAIRMVNGTLVVTDSAFVSNFSTNSGVGAALQIRGGAVWVTNTTFARNALLRVFSAGPVAIANAGVLVVTNSTFAENTATIASSTPRTSGLLGSFPGATTIVQNSIIVHATGDLSIQDCSGSIVSLGNNIFADPTGCDLTMDPGDLLGDPGLGAFADDETSGNGHFPLLRGSVAIDAGNNAVCPRQDQIGQLRKARCDIGAVEFRENDRKDRKDGNDRKDDTTGTNSRD